MSLLLPPPASDAPHSSPASHPSPAPAGPYTSLHLPMGCLPGDVSSRGDCVSSYIQHARTHRPGGRRGCPPPRDSSPILAPHLPLPAAGRALLTLSSRDWTHSQSCGKQWVRHQSWLSFLCLARVSFPPLLPLLDSTGGRWALKLQSI